MHLILLTLVSPQLKDHIGHNFAVLTKDFWTHSSLFSQFIIGVGYHRGANQFINFYSQITLKVESTTLVLPSRCFGKIYDLLFLALH